MTECNARRPRSLNACVRYAQISYNSKDVRRPWIGPLLTAGPLNLGFPEVLVIALVALLLFGTKKVGELGKGLGEGIHNFKTASRATKKRT